MGVYIKDMVMPKSCVGCKISKYGSIDEWEMYCSITGNRVGNWGDDCKSRAKDCPLVEVEDA